MSVPPFEFALGVLFTNLTTPGPFYLPDLVRNSSEPTLEPYAVSGSWTVSPSAALGTAAQQICIAEAAVRNIDTGQTTAPPILTLCDAATAKFPSAEPFTISGISSVVPSKPSVTDPTTDAFTFSLTFGTSGNSQGLTISGNFLIEQGCQGYNIDGTPNGAPFESNGYGLWSVDVASSTVVGNAHLTYAGNLGIVVDSLHFSADVSQKNLRVQIKILSSSDDPDIQAGWNSCAEEAMNDPQALRALVFQVDAEANSERVRDTVAGIMQRAFPSMVP